ncbi:MAG: SPOR domain-containing protein [Chitinophagales bacterium]
MRHLYLTSFYTILCIFLLLSICDTIQAQTQSEEGQRLAAIGIVLDSQNKKPIKNTEVFLLNKETNKIDTLITSINGNYAFQLESKKQYSIFAMKYGASSERYDFVTPGNGESEIFQFNLIIPVYNELASRGFKDQLEAGGRKLHIIGIVLDEDTKKPIQNATIIKIDDTTNKADTVHTSTNGNFVFDVSPSKSYMLYGTKGSAESKPYYLITKDNPSEYIYYSTLVLNGSSNDRNVLVSNTIAPPTLTDYVESITFSVQIGVFAREVPRASDFLKPIARDLEVDRTTDGWYRYVVGSFTDYNEAVNYKATQLPAGYKNTSIIAYANGEVIEGSLEEVVKLVERGRK